MPKRTFQPNRRHRSKTHGFRTRMKTKSGAAVISRRRAKGRKRVSVKPGFRERTRQPSRTGVVVILGFKFRTTQWQKGMFPRRAAIS